MEDISIEASAGLPAAKVLCGDVGVAGEGGRGAEVGWLVIKYRGEGPVMKLARMSILENQNKPP